MSETVIWEVDLTIYGPISVVEPMQFDRIKSGNDPFYREIKLNKTDFGVLSTITAQAPTVELARKATALFFGRVVDILGFNVDLPLRISLYSNKRSDFTEKFAERRRISAAEWEKSLNESWALDITKPDYLKGLSWYRKGMISEDPFDQFLALWNSMEVITSHHHPPLPPEHKTGSKSQMWESFKKIWGIRERWPHIEGNYDWVYEMYEYRKLIAHGTEPVNVQTIERVANKLDSLRKVSRQFLIDSKDNLF